MTPSSSPPSEPNPSCKASLATILESISDYEPDHPAYIALRTYSLCASLSLGPALLLVIVAPVVHPDSFGARALLKALRPTGFASAITVAVGGGAALQRLWGFLERRHIHYTAWVHSISQSPLCQRAFLANLITSTLAITLLRWKRRRRPGTVSPTLDLSLLFLVRALDATAQAFLLRNAQDTTVQEPRAISPDDLWKKRVVTHLDALVFWASSARIMWCFFYQPRRLSPPYAKWISSLANVDHRLLEVLRALREGTWSYIHSSSAKRSILGPVAEGLGRSSSWGHPAVLPAYGGNLANEAWKHLGVDGRSGIGGLPCELVHGGIGAMFGLQNSCIANAVIRAICVFAKALVIFLPVHSLPILLTKPSSIMCPRHAIPVLISAIRSATFLSTFLSSYWFAVTRTLVRPGISHDVWDGPYGCTLAGSLICGVSIWIENLRRGEMALYVLPRALRASISEKWLHNKHPAVQFAECLIFILSLASLLTLSVHQPESLRGLSRWTLAFVMKGSNAGFCKERRREIATSPPIPKDSVTLIDSGYYET